MERHAHLHGAGSRGGVACAGAGGVQPFLNTLTYIQNSFPFFNASVAAGFANHIVVQVADYGFTSNAWGNGLIDSALLERMHIRPGATLP